MVYAYKPGYCQVIICIDPSQSSSFMQHIYKYLWVCIIPGQVNVAKRTACLILNPWSKVIKINN